mgnify:CR=1 FL=1
MTEKKMNPDQELTQEEQQQLEGEEQFFKQQFSSLPSPKLPGSLSAQAMWEKICAGEGDHQITVDPTQMEPQAPQKPEGKVLDFPGSHKTEEKPKRNLTVYRRRWAIACTLVLVVGLSAAYWKWQRPMEQMKDMVTAESAAEQPVEEVAEEAAEDMFMEKQKTSKEHREDDKKILEFQEILERLIHEEMQRKKEGEYRCRSLDEAIRKKQQARREAAAACDGKKNKRNRKGCR